MEQQKRLDNFNKEIKTIITMNNEILKSYFDFDIDKQGNITSLTITDSYDEIKILILCLGAIVGEYEMLAKLVTHVAKELDVPSNRKADFKTGLMRICLHVIDSIVQQCQEKINLIEEEK